MAGDAADDGIEGAGPVGSFFGVVVDDAADVVLDAIEGDVVVVVLAGDAADEGIEGAGPVGSFFGVVVDDAADVVLVDETDEEEDGAGEGEGEALEPALALARRFVSESLAAALLTAAKMSLFPRRPAGLDAGDAAAGEEGAGAEGAGAGAATFSADAGEEDGEAAVVLPFEGGAGLANEVPLLMGTDIAATDGRAGVGAGAARTQGGRPPRTTCKRRWRRGRG